MQAPPTDPLYDAIRMKAQERKKKGDGYAVTVHTSRIEKVGKINELQSRILRGRLASQKIYDLK